MRVTTSQMVLPRPLTICFHVVKDRIQDQAIEVECMSMSECFTDPFIEGLPPNCKIMLLAWVVGKPF